MICTEVISLEPARPAQTVEELKDSGIRNFLLPTETADLRKLGHKC